MRHDQVECGYCGKAIDPNNPPLECSRQHRLPAAPQPEAPPRCPFCGTREWGHKCGQILSQPEAPTLADELVRRLRAIDYSAPHDELCHEAAARIESDAERIRVLETDLGRYMMLANTNAADLAASREREARIRKLAEAVTQWDWSDNDAECVRDVDNLRHWLELATPDSVAPTTGATK